ncbi:DUF1302 family protein [Parvibaculum sp.]|uniref:DUF1302 family protein n=1 Tax=Parvibaculum sp. TaxID=2024848 RepID=UPI003450F736
MQSASSPSTDQALDTCNVPRQVADSCQFGDMSLSVDTTITTGVPLRASDRGCTKYNPLNGGGATSDGRMTGIDSDNGNLNYDQWIFLNKAVKATIDVQDTWENYCFFLRPSALMPITRAPGGAA